MTKQYLQDNLSNKNSIESSKEFGIKEIISINAFNNKSVSEIVSQANAALKAAEELYEEYHITQTSLIGFRLGVKEGLKKSL